MVTFEFLVFGADTPLAFLEVFTNVVLPVFLIAGAGAFVHRFKPIPVAPLSQTILYLFSPALVFHGLSTTEIPLAELGQIALFSLLLLVALYLVGQLGGALLRISQPERRALVIAAIFMNAGNYGLPVAFFAFGDEGLSKAIVFFVIQATLGWTVGIFLASRAHAGPLEAIRAVFTVPTTYAATIGFLVGVLSLSVPRWFLQATDVLGDAAIPAMLIVLGIQLASTRAFASLRTIAGALSVRLVFSALIAYGLTQVLGIDDLTSKVLIVVAGMPTAVFTIILATEYGGKAELASSIVVASTLASLVSVTVLLTLVGAE